MWHKKKWIIIAVTAAAVILVGGIVGGVAYAQTTSPTQPNPSISLPDRVAKILGLDPKTVENAFTQAQKDQQNEAVSNRLSALVTQGKLTQAQADDYKAWLQSKPNVPAGLALPGGQANGPMMGPGGHIGFRGFRGFPGKPAPGSTLTPKPTTTP